MVPAKEEIWVLTCQNWTTQCRRAGHRRAEIQNPGVWFDDAAAGLQPPAQHPPALQKRGGKPTAPAFCLELQKTAEPA
jgi:hypothetical protein